jgi:hypothetical protein
VALLLIPGMLHSVMLSLMAAIEGRVQWHRWLTPRPDGPYHTPIARAARNKQQIEVFS